MRKITKKLAIALLAGITAAAGMGISASAAKKNSVKITVKPDNIKLAVGECIKIKKSASPKDPEQKWKFSSQDKDIALVSRNGNIVGLKGGTARIRVRAVNKNTVKTIKVTVDGDALYVCKTSLAKFVKMGIAAQEESTEEGKESLKYTIKDQTWKTMKFSNRTLTDTYITLDNVKTDKTYIESEKSYWLNARTSNMGKVEFVAKDAAATTKFEGTHIRPVLEIGTMARVTSVKYSADGLVILDPSSSGGSIEINTAADSTVNAGIQGGGSLTVNVTGGNAAKTNIDLDNVSIGDIDIAGAKNQVVSISSAGTTGSTISNIKIAEGTDDQKLDIGSNIMVGKVESQASGGQVETSAGVKEIPQNGSITNPNGSTGGGGGGAVSYGDTYTISKSFTSTVGNVSVTFANAGKATFTRAALDQLLADALQSGAAQTISSEDGEFTVTFAGTAPTIGSGGAINASGVTATVTKSGAQVGKYDLSVTGTYGKNYTVTADWSAYKTTSQKITLVEETKN